MDDKIKVMHVRDSSGIFGAERVILAIGKNIDRKRFDIQLLCMRRPEGRNGSLVRKAREVGIKTESVNVNGRLDLGAISKIKKILSENGVQIIHSHDFKSDFYALVASLNSGIRKISTAHGSTRDSWLKRFYLYWDEKVFYRAFDRIVAVSEDLKIFLKCKGIPADKIQVIQNGLDFQMLRAETSKETPLDLPSGKTLFAVIGRLYPDKGHRFFLKALKIVLETNPDAFGLIIGDGPEQESINRQIRQLRIEQHIKLCGVRSDMQAIYDRIDCLVISSLTEGLPYVLLESMANRVPVIASAVGDVPTLIEDNVTGRLVPPGDAASLARCMMHLLDNPESARAMAEAGEVRVSSGFSAEKMVRQTEELYMRLLDRLETVER